MWFDMPPPPPPQIVQTECATLYSELVRPAHPDVISGHRRAQTAAEAEGRIDETFIRQRREAIQDERLLQPEQ